MEDNNSTVVTEEVQSEQVDAVQAESHDSDGVMALSEMLDVASEEVTEETTEEAQDTDTVEPVQEEPKVSGGIKGRLNAEHKKGYEAGRQAAYSEWQAEKAEMQARLDKLEQYELREKAQAIAKQQNVSMAIAEFLAKNGFDAPDNAASNTNTPPRDANGRFVSTKTTEQNNDGSMSRAQFLFDQSKTIERMTGVNAMELFQNADASTKHRIATGEMDFADLVEQANVQPKAKRTPPVIKSSSATGSAKTIRGMSDEELDKINNYLRGGGVIDMSK